MSHCLLLSGAAAQRILPAGRISISLVDWTRNPESPLQKPLDSETAKAETGTTSGSRQQVALPKTVNKPSSPHTAPSESRTQPQVKAARCGQRAARKTVLLPGSGHEGVEKD